jgi:hypothetical protein
VPRHATLQTFMVSPAPRCLVIRQFIEQDNVIVAATAGADAPFGVDAFAPRHFLAKFGPFFRLTPFRGPEFTPVSLSLSSHLRI